MSPSSPFSVLPVIPGPLPFIAVTPCRLVDTRGTSGVPINTGGSFTANEARTWTFTGLCGIASSAAAVSLNITVTNTGGQTPFGFVKVWPGGGTEPNVSTLNWSTGGVTVANAAIVPFGRGGNAGMISLRSSNNSSDVIVDVNGYYAPAGAGAHNAFLGLNAGNFTMTGDFNTGFGYAVLFTNSTGGYNTGLGSGALFSNSAGSDNTATGTGALSNSTGSSNIGIGFQAGSSLTTGSNDICIGNSGVAGESDTIRIGSSQTATFMAGINGVNVGGGSPVYINSSGQLGTGVTVSSRRFKQDIRDIADESDGLMRLRPVAFKYKPELDSTGLTQYGLIAEEVVEVYPHLVGYDRDGQLRTVYYDLINALMLNEVQKQHRTVEAQEKTIEQQKAEIEELKARMSRLEARPTEPRP